MSSSTETMTIPAIDNVVIPPEIADRDEAREVKRLHDECLEAVAGLRELAAQEGAAVEADRHALAAACAAGKPDPGDRALTALRDKVAAQQRRVIGLADAWGEAYARLRALVATDRDAWAAAADDELARAVVGVDKALGGLNAAFDEVERIRRWHVWLRQAADPLRVQQEGLPSNLSSATRSFQHGPTPLSRDDVVGMIRRWTEVRA